MKVWILIEQFGEYDYSEETHGVYASEEAALAVELLVRQE